ncbi:MAG: alpha-ketoacid dehydrogenase subunit beta [Sneathiella sp.]|jgi:pyruvate dehydrogenase E1 component beta subunit|uniref:alpha-ketoacid dehydrogenase subunit beta n=1 Tax=Sneathiella sp. TaxID=1964365 RepID=UPI000C5F3FF1|nr:alpha-ketoacid dehydrogenase subunit beta [Sneathiella sp.]MAL77915.1 alpha-ketoacid dehydrogenase subunit beta [Sneathiella sp.]
MAEVRFAKAINMALDETLTKDPSVVVFGEDVAHAGGPFGVTRGLLDTHGELRVRDTPISEATIVSAAVGAAMSGLKPVVEIMFMDFVAIAMDGLVNQAAKARFMFGGQCSVPMVLRTPHGGGVNAGPQHSQCLEAWFAHIPGLKVVVPSNPSDAYQLLKAAILDPDPVIFIENKAMYSMKGDLDEAAPAIEIGKAHIARAGDDVTIVSYGAAVNTALAAAATLAERDIEAEVVDLRSIQPWDEETVLQSLSRTHRLVILHEAVTNFGVGAEIAARMADIGFDELDAPIIRVGAPFMPVPFAKSLESRYLPDADDVIAAVEKVLA